MSWSLQIRNGDLTLGQARYGTVNGEAKLVQDLRLWFLEKVGTDDFHPTFGSLLDGGFSGGEEQQGVIGLTDPALARTLAESEIRRIVNEYQARQLSRAKRERTQYGKTTFSRGEILLSLDQIQVSQTMDSLNIRLFITTASDNQIQLDIPVTL